MWLRLNGFSPFKITNPDSGENPGGSLADRGEGMWSVLQGEACKVWRISFKIPLWYLLGALGTRPRATRALCGGIRVWIVPSSVGPRAGQGQGCSGARHGPAAAPRRSLPACPSPHSHTFKTSWSLEPFCYKKHPFCPRHHLLQLRFCPAHSPGAGLRSSLIQRWLSPGGVPSTPELSLWCPAGEPLWCSWAKLLPEGRGGVWSTIKAAQEWPTSIIPICKAFSQERWLNLEHLNFQIMSS